MEWQRRTRGWLRKKGKIDEEKNSMIKIDSDKEERERKEKKKKKRGEEE